MGSNGRSGGSAVHARVSGVMGEPAGPAWLAQWPAGPRPSGGAIFSLFLFVLFSIYFFFCFYFILVFTFYKSQNKFLN